MNLSHLYYFKKLAEVKHYTKAAEVLYIAQPTLSIAISRLEEELGTPLFTRDGTTIELTGCGREFYHFVSLALQNLDRGVRVVQEYAGKSNATIDIGTLYAMQNKYWSEAIHQFHEVYKVEPHIGITQGYSVGLTQALKRGELDVLFASKVGNDPDLNYTLFWSQPLALCVSKSHPLATRKHVSLKDLCGYHILSYQPSSPVAGALDDLVDGYELDIDRSFDDEITMSSLVTSDPHNIALLCYSFLVKAFDEVVYLPVIEAPTDFHKIFLVFRNEQRSKMLNDFIEFMARYSFPVEMVPQPES